MKRARSALALILMYAMALMPYEEFQRAWDDQPKSLRRNTAAFMDVGKWVYAVIIVIVALMIIAGLYPSLNTALASWAANDTSGFGTTVQTIVPIALGASVLIAVVLGFLALTGFGKKGKL